MQAQYAHESTADLWLNPEQFALGLTMAKDQNLETNFDLIVNLQKHYTKQSIKCIVLKMDIFNVLI